MGLRPRRLPAAVVAAALAGCLTAARPARAQHAEINVYSTASGSGALTTDFDFREPAYLSPRLSFCPGGICPYSDIAPGIVAPAEGRPDEGLHPLGAGAEVRFVLQAIDAAASVKFGATILRNPGQSATVGVADFHAHPEWQLQLREEESGEYPVSFKLTSDRYTESRTFTLLLTNRTPSGEPTPSFTPAVTTAPATATPIPTEDTPSACAGDCNTDGAVDVGELVTAVNIALGLASPSACPALGGGRGDQVTIDDVMQAVAAALNGC